MKTKIKGWIARDDDGELCFYLMRPAKCNTVFMDEAPAENMMLWINKIRFPEVKPMQCKRATITIELTN